MNAFIEHHQPAIRFDYSCFDRILFESDHDNRRAFDQGNRWDTRVIMDVPRSTGGLLSVPSLLGVGPRWV